jgi:hypothetical protein
LASAYAGFLLGLLCDPEEGSDMFLRKVELGGVTTQKTILFTVSVVRTPNPTSETTFV